MAYPYTPGSNVEVQFTVDDTSGLNTTGLAWTVALFTVDDTKLTSGTEFTSITVTEDVSTEWYTLNFTPDSNSISRYFIKITSDAAIADVFLENFIPELGIISSMLTGKMVHDIGVEPETITFYRPDGLTILKKFSLVKSGTTDTRTDITP